MLPGFSTEGLLPGDSIGKLVSIFFHGLLGKHRNLVISVIIQRQFAPKSTLINGAPIKIG
jgi:hypothetical protein